MRFGGHYGWCFDTCESGGCGCMCFWIGELLLKGVDDIVDYNILVGVFSMIRGGVLRMQPGSLGLFFNQWIGI